MPASSRMVFGREFEITPVWLWLVQRASGVLLGPLVALHIWSPNLVVNALLLAVVVVHGYSGLRRVATAKGKAAVYTMLAVAWCAAVVVLGTLVLVVVSGT